MITHRSAIFLAVLSSILSSLAWIFQGAAVAQLTPLAVASGQALLAGLIYFAHIRRSGQNLPLTEIRWHWKDLARFTILRSVIGSVLVCYSLTLSGSIKVMFFTKLEPYFVLFWAWLLEGRKISGYHAFLLLIHISGAVLLSTGGEFELAGSQWGDLMLVSAVAVLSYSYLQAARLSKELGPIHLNGVSAFVSGLFLLPPAIAISPVATWNFFSVAWLDVVIVVLLFNVFALTLWYSTLRYLEGWLVSALRAIGPVFAAPVAWYFFNQRLGWVQLLGAAVVLATSAMLARDRKKEEGRD